MQQSRANPLLSRLGCATTIVMILVLGIILRYFGGGPFSPGHLSAASPRQEPLAGFASHAEFEADCSLCHAPWAGSAADRCQSCHVDIKEQRLARVGLHGRLPDAGECGLCHTEHKGREANITDFELQSFEHDWLTDFSLAKHQSNFDGRPMKCQDCHAQGRYAAEGITCHACHVTAEPTFIGQHIALYGDDCLACHDGHDAMVGFDHQAVFPLEGGHANQACGDCHEPTVLAGAPEDCSGCHVEVDLGWIALVVTMPWPGCLPV